MRKNERDEMFRAGFVRGLETAVRFPWTIAACSTGDVRAAMMDCARRIDKLAEEARDFKFQKKSAA